MDLLKQLEAKLQSLVQQRNELRDQVAALQAEAEEIKEEGLKEDEELHRLRAQVEALTHDKEALVAEREELSTQVAGILKLVEDLK
jgi:chromosome segregation protein